MDKERTFNAFRICITDRKCENTDCPYEYECEKVNSGYIQIPKVLALDVMQLLKAQDEIISELLKVGYPHGYDNEEPWIQDYMQLITEVMRKAVRLRNGTD